MNDKKPTREERNAEMQGTQNAPGSIGDIIKKMPPLTHDRGQGHPTVPRPEPKKRVASGKFILTCWDGDIYILEGFTSEDEVIAAIGGMDWVKMPNGARIKASSIAKVQSYEDYSFQKDQKWRHSRGQYLAGKDMGKWWHNADGPIRDRDVAAITGRLDQPQLPQASSTAPHIALEDGKP